MKNRDDYYFENLIACVDCSERAATLLEQTLKSYDSIQITKQMDLMHEIEHEGDNLKHTMVNTLYKAFITPIEREDIIALSSCLDDITDTIEDVLLQLYICGIKTIKPNAIQLAEGVVTCCKELRVLIEGLKDLKKSNKLRDHIIRINDLEEQADQLYMESMYQLHKEYSTAIEVIVWREVYNLLEKCVDACEHAADLVETVMIKNS